MEDRYGQVHVHFPGGARCYRFCKFLPGIAKFILVPPVGSKEPPGLLKWRFHYCGCCVPVSPMPAARSVAARNGKCLPLKKLIIITGTG